MISQYFTRRDSVSFTGRAATTKPVFSFRNTPFRVKTAAVGSDNFTGFMAGSGFPCQLAVFSGKLPSMKAEMDCTLQSNSS